MDLPRSANSLSSYSHITKTINNRTDAPTSIPSPAWSKASSAVFTSGASCTAIAEDVTVLDNLRGIPSALNAFKKQVFTGNLTGKGYPSSGDGATYFNYFGPATQKYLSENQDGLKTGVINDVGDQLQTIGDGEQPLKDYFTSFANFHYQGCIDFLSTWTGKSYARPTATSSTAKPTAAAVTTTSGSTFSCYAAADPGTYIGLQPLISIYCGIEPTRTVKR